MSSRHCEGPPRGTSSTSRPLDLHMPSLTELAPIVTAGVSPPEASAVLLHMDDLQ
ncbi:hypothetical protein PC116_g25475 [Phytophthora cactorum]|nr:hypothetical protein PC120_g22790 [Phytophthora cactorum]KAG4226112.1 hypothetical protein PC116_g25475 [Phytophthora cactorum]